MLLIVASPFWNRPATVPQHFCNWLSLTKLSLMPRKQLSWAHSGKRLLVLKLIFVNFIFLWALTRNLYASEGFCSMFLIREMYHCDPPAGIFQERMHIRGHEKLRWCMTWTSFISRLLSRERRRFKFWFFADDILVSLYCRLYLRSKLHCNWIHKVRKYQGR